MGRDVEPKLDRDAGKAGGVHGIAEHRILPQLPPDSHPCDERFATRALREFDRITMLGHMKTALTPQEWEELRAGRANLEIWDDPHPGSGILGVEDQSEDAPRGYARVHPDARHALAALALHDQAFGFTWEDVDRLREAVNDIDFSHIADPEQRKLMELDTRVMRAWMLDLADRVADLLPPRVSGYS
jgi:hypothetical protein